MGGISRRGGCLIQPVQLELLNELRLPAPVPVHQPNQVRNCYIQENIGFGLSLMSSGLVDIKSYYVHT